MSLISRCVDRAGSSLLYCVTLVPNFCQPRAPSPFFSLSSSFSFSGVSKKKDRASARASRISSEDTTDSNPVM